MLIAVNCFEIDAALRTDAGEIGTPRSRLAIPYPRSYSVVPFRLIATLHPGAPGLFHSAKSWSMLSFDDFDLGCEHAVIVTRASAPIDARWRVGIVLTSQV
jgi:hypothetical protein